MSTDETLKAYYDQVADTRRAQHNDRFAGYRKPNPMTIPKYEKISTKTKELADLIYDECPDSLEKSKALTDLQNVRMWANAAVAIHS